MSTVSRQNSSTTTNNTTSLSPRLQAELDLLTAMYPDSLTFNPRTSELCLQPESSNSTRSSSAKLILRLPEMYPDGEGVPEVVLATVADKSDLRQIVNEYCRQIYAELAGGSGGEEVLDAIILRFLEIVERRERDVEDENGKNGSVEQQQQQALAQTTSKKPTKAVIIWLHHLLATSKRKLAIRPSSTCASGIVSGISKPGYPGILLFTGPGDIVDEHVTQLKGLNWQAFSVRYEEEEGEWLIDGGYGGGTKEVESMSAVVSMIEEGRRREVFLRAVGIK